MNGLFYIQTEHTLIPSDLIRAVQDFEGFSSVHLEYWRRHGGLEGLCTYRDAFEYLVSDLRDHGLPVRYTTFNSFKVQKCRKR